MQVLYISAECKPYSKVGGVGDVAGELPWALKEQGLGIEIITPLYGSVSLKDQSLKKTGDYLFQCQGKPERVEIFSLCQDEVWIHFIKNNKYFENDYSSPYIHSPLIPFYDDILRFSFFSEACLFLVEEKNPDIVHLNDWVLSYLSARMYQKKLSPKKMLTIHNMQYQGNIGIDNIRGWEIEKLYHDSELGPLFTDPRKEFNSVNAMRLGLETADKINTVSPQYCLEITKPDDPEKYFQGGVGLEQITSRLYAQNDLSGILNGYNYSFAPTPEKFQEILSRKAEMKKNISARFGQQVDFLLGFVGRAVDQKCALLAETLEGKSVLEHILDIPGLYVAVLATGLPKYEAFFRSLTSRSNFLAELSFNQELASQISLGSDVFLMPSLFEPCGITQMDSMSRATPPLVRWTGGLVDTVKAHTSPGGTGFGFNGQNKKEILNNFLNTVKEAYALYRTNPDGFADLQKNAFYQRFLWSESAKSYIQIYERFFI